MTDPKPPVGLLKTIGLWLLDFAKMPGRVAELAKAKQAESDKRLACISCATGRIGALRPMSQSLNSSVQGTCDQCRCRYVLDGKGSITGVLGVHSPPPS